jgi:hypothetical protein
MASAECVIPALSSRKLQCFIHGNTTPQTNETRAEGPRKIIENNPITDTKQTQASQLPHLKYADIVPNPLLLVLCYALGNPCDIPDFLF